MEGGVGGGGGVCMQEVCWGRGHLYYEVVIEVEGCLFVSSYFKTLSPFIILFILIFPHV